MDTCSNSCEKSQRTERVKEERVSRKKIREEKESKKKEEEERMIKVCEKVGTSRNTVFSQWFVAPEGRQVGSLKQQVRSHMAGWDPNVFWRDADLEVKKLKTSHVRSNFGNWAVEKVHAVAARSTFRSKMFLKKCTRLQREAHVEVEMSKSPQVQCTFGS